MKTLKRIALLTAILGALLFSCGREGPGPKPDTTPPKVHSTIPADAATNVPLNSAIYVTFSETMNPATINDQTIVLTRGGTLVPGSVTCTGATAVFQLQTSLDANTLYTLTVGTGVQDESGNPLGDPYQCVFMTGEHADTTAPTVISSEPAGDAVPIYSPVSVVFSERMNVSTVTADTFRVSAGGMELQGTVTLDSQGTKALFTLQFPPFSYDTDVLVRIVSGASGVKDLAGNALATDHTWSFKTAVQPSDPTYTLTVTKSGTGDGLVTADTGTLVWYENTGLADYEQGTTVLLSVSAFAGSVFDGWTGCTSVSGAICRIDMDAARTVSALFTLTTYTIAAGSGPNGSISPSGPVAVSYGGTQAFSIVPDEGYHVADVLVDLVSAGAATIYTFENVTGDHEISASFAINTHTITASAGLNGSISPQGTIEVEHGGTQSFEITPDDGQSVVDVLVDDASVGAVTTYAFENVTMDHTISASFTATEP